MNPMYSFASLRQFNIGWLFGKREAWKIGGESKKAKDDEDDAEQRNKFKFGYQLRTFIQR